MAEEKDPAGHGEQSASDGRVAPAPKKYKVCAQISLSHSGALAHRGGFGTFLVVTKQTPAGPHSSRTTPMKCQHGTDRDVTVTITDPTV